LKDKKDKYYPNDDKFSESFKSKNFYDKNKKVIDKTKVILEIIEESFSHKEKVSFKNLTIEHIMPQTLSEWWKDHLGKKYEEIHELYLHTIGNLTLTAYNSELSNSDFIKKKKELSNSKLEINKYFNNISKWTEDEIKVRAEELSKKALEIWSYFGKENTNSISELKTVTGTKPYSLKILGQNFRVNSWRDVMETTFNVISDLAPDKFQIILDNFPKYVGKDKSKFREVRKLENSYFIEVNLSSEHIQKICYQAIEITDLSSEDWEVLFN